MKKLKTLDQVLNRKDSLYLITPDQHLLMWENETDEMIVRRPMNGLKHDSICSDEEMSKERITQVIDRFYEEIRYPITSSFHLKELYVLALKDTIRISNATHVRFYAKSGLISVVVFDLKKFVRDAGTVFPDDLAIHQIALKDQDKVPDFSFSMNARSFLKIPESSYDIDVHDNGIAEFIGLDDDVEIFVRDQLIREPISRMFNEKLGLDIVLVSQATKELT